nr:MAG TPA: hypothetical protein [Caudoviricetes sp.]
MKKHKCADFAQMRHCIRCDCLRLSIFTATSEIRWTKFA